MCAELTRCESAKADFVPFQPRIYSADGSGAEFPNGIMIVEGEHTFQAPRLLIWNLLQDPEVLIKALPGAKRLERVSDDRYEGVMRVGFGPITAAEWGVNVTLSDRVEPASYGMQIDSKGPLGFTRGNAHVELDDVDVGATRMRYRADLQIGGKVAGIGQRLLDQVAKLMTRQGLEALNREVEARVAGGGA